MPTINDILARAAVINNTTVANITMDAIKRLASILGVYKDLANPDLENQTIATVLARAADINQTTVANITPYAIQCLSSAYGLDYSADPAVLTDRDSPWQDWMAKGPAAGAVKQPLSLGTGTSLPTIPPAGVELGDYYELQVTLNAVNYIKRFTYNGMKLAINGDPTDPTDYVINWVEGKLEAA